jgi:hypothetical protein
VFLRYFSETRVIGLFDRYFGSMRKSSKGQPVADIFEQLISFLQDGTSFHLARFDALKEDEGYAAILGSRSESLLSSHSAKRFIQGFSFVRIYGFRRVLREPFLWRLLLEKPSVIIFGIDTMVMDNGEAEKRHGVSTTYIREAGESNLISPEGLLGCKHAQGNQEYLESGSPSGALGADRLTTSPQFWLRKPGEGIYTVGGFRHPPAGGAPKIRLSALRLDISTILLAFP